MGFIGPRELDGPLMSKLLSPGQCRFAIQLCAASAVAALLSGCSADSTRFNDAFGNPFATGSTEKPHKVSTANHPVGTGRTPPVVATALPPRATSAAGSAPASLPVVVSRETTGSIGPVHAVPNTSFGGWTGQGGAAVQVSQGDTAEMLSKRYGVPQNILLQVNGLKSASDVQPGITIVVPVYNAVATLPQAQAPRVAVATPAPLVHPRSAPAARVAQAEPEVARAVPAHVLVAKAEPVAAPVREAPARKGKLVVSAPAKVAAVVPTRTLKAPLMTASADGPVVKGKTAAHGVAAPVAVKVAPVKVAAATVAAKPLAPAPKVAARAPVAAAPKVEQAIDRKVIDPTPTASLPPAAAAPAAGAAPTATVADAGGPEFRWPARGRIIQGFKGGAGGNDGINIAVPEGTAVKAAEGGVVAYAGSELKGYGNLVLIRHPNGYVTAYANNGEIDVKRGETVKRGQMIAKSGQSGNVSSPQLHFELRKGSQPVDPTSYLAGL